MSFLSRIFNRGDDEESDDLSIYKDKPATNRSASLLFGFFALLITLLIAGGLFFGGRAVYRALNGSSDNKTATPKKENNTNQSKNTASGSFDAQSKPSTSESEKKKSNKPASTPSTGDNLPSTGDNVPLPKTGDPGM